MSIVSSMLAFDPFQHCLHRSDPEHARELTDADVRGKPINEQVPLIDEATLTLATLPEYLIARMEDI
jgi:hypothetical protein